tara:strand:- start:11320 stop:13797 length:2478 start_codon:yes stop_codon:yes gene_type:complete
MINTSKKIKVIKKSNPNKLKVAEWVLPNKKRFPKWINETFRKYLLAGENKVTNKTKGFKPFTHQKLVRDFMQNESPYRGLLLFHGLGSGKTCTSITIAENLKNYKNILVMTPASIKNNYINKGLMFCGDPRYKALPSLIDDHYSFISTNAPNTYKQMTDNGSLDNHVIIIDEVHNLVSRMVSGLIGNSKQGKKIYEMLMNTTNCKIIALTGTPIINYPIEAGILLNILRGKIDVHIFRITKMNPDLVYNTDIVKLNLERIKEIDFIEINIQNRTIEMKILINENDDKFQKFIKTIEAASKGVGVEIKYLMPKSYTAFPESDEEFDKFFLDSTGKGSFKLKNKDLFIRRSLGLISYYESTDSNFPAYEIKNIDITMSGYQFILYDKVREVEKDRERMAMVKMKSGTKKDKPTSLMRIYSRMFSNFVFPEDNPRPFKRGSMASLMKKNKNNVNNSNFDKINKDMVTESMISENQNKITKEYNERINRALVKLDNTKSEYLTIDKLEKYSPKMKRIMEEILDSPGLVLVYSQFRKLEGIGVFELVLRANGFSKYGEKGVDPKFAIYSGEENSEYREETLKVFNSPDNKIGANLKVLMISSAGSEGLDLKNIRQIHIMEPYWNEVRIKQVIGRGVRHESHIDLPIKDRNVKVYRYFSLMSEKDKDFSKEKKSTDQYIYEVALKKEGITNDILETFKEVAFDCVLNKGSTKIKQSCFSFGNDETGLASLPDISKDLVYSSTVTQSKKIKRSLTLAFITSKKMVIIADKKNKKVYSIIDAKKKHPLKKIPKIKKKVRVDTNSKIVYDDKSASKTGELIKLGSYNNTGKFSK